MKYISFIALLISLLSIAAYAEEALPKANTEEDRAFKEVLKNVKLETAKEPAKKPVKEKNRDFSKKSYRPGVPFSDSEFADIRHQLESYWSPPAGINNRPDMRVTLKLGLNREGVITSVASTDKSERYNTDPLYHSAMDSALKAVWKCGQIKRLDPKKFDMWRIMIVTFDLLDF
jgi:hypothetical protein